MGFTLGYGYRQGTSHGVGLLGDLVLPGVRVGARAGVGTHACKAGSPDMWVKKGSAMLQAEYRGQACVLPPELMV